MNDPYKTADLKNSIIFLKVFATTVNIGGFELLKIPLGFL